MASENKYQVVICGGGLAGLTLSLQLRKLFPKAAVTVIEKITRPLPEAAHKVGESTVEIGGHYFSEVLDLKTYLQEKQFPKLGLRYFYGDASQPFDQRAELGPSMFSPVPTFQLDRGTLENDLREMAITAGVNLIEGASLKEIEIIEGGLNRVSYSFNELEQTIDANWVVDAMGRRRYIQTKLGLKKESPHSASSVWFRYEGKVTVDDLVPKSNLDWHQRNVEDRYYSTNHLMGLGYWVWLIPLASGNTSVGIVTQNDLHDFAAYSRSYETSFEWIRSHEPRLAEYLENKQPLDFRKIKNYSYGSEQLFSGNGWSCVGEAGIFSDPFYSPGSDMIAITNTFTCNLIEADLNGELNTDKVNLLNDFILKTVFPDQLSYYVGGYHTFGNTQIASTKFLWDTLYYWRVYAHAFMNGVYSDLNHLQQFESYVKQFSELNRALQLDFKKWAETKPSQEHFAYADLARKGAFIESAIMLTTRPNKNNYHQHWEEQLSFLRDMRNAIVQHNSKGKMNNDFAPFTAFYGKLPAVSQLKNRINGQIARISNGAFLYSVRNLYIRFFVRGKERVRLAWLLRVLYAR
ncbi:MAG: hypothetical protein RL266_269 [Bacteroidota bacterium]|jgi:flavin-dependent dehydrogenase